MVSTVIGQFAYYLHTCYFLRFDIDRSYNIDVMKLANHNYFSEANRAGILLHISADFQFAVSAPLLHPRAQSKCRSESSQILVYIIN